MVMQRFPCVNSSKHLGIIPDLKMKSDDARNIEANGFPFFNFKRYMPRMLPASEVYNDLRVGVKVFYGLNVFAAEAAKMRLVAVRDGKSQHLCGPGRVFKQFFDGGIKNGGIDQAAERRMPGTGQHGAFLTHFRRRLQAEADDGDARRRKR
ncbi:MAG: hypothetical protein WC883_11305, partial [Smithellaceae bacterium]